MGGYKGVYDGSGIKALQDQITAANANIASLQSTKADASATFGIGQSWSDVTASRVSGTTYTNSTGKPIMVAVTATSNAQGSVSASLTVNGVVVSTSTAYAQSASYGTFMTGIVPIGATYTATIGGTNASLTKWEELR